MNLIDAYKLFHHSTMTLQDMSHHGICVDVEYLENMYNNVLPVKIKELTEKLLKHKEIQRWKKEEGKNWSLDSDTQLQRLIYGTMGHNEYRGARKTDQAAMLGLNLPFAEELIAVRQYTKCRNTYIKGLLEEQVGGVIHANMTLNLVVTYRGSCNSPNLQNQPKRNAVIAEIVRTAFIPSTDFQFTEYDFKGMEVCIAACYHEDPAMIRYLCDPTLDMHWDSASDCYCLHKYSMSDWKLNPKAVKKIRYCGKNMFTFPQFYGSWWKECAQNLWEEVDNLYMPDGSSVRKNLAKNGITELGEVELDETGRYHVEKGTFYHHIQKVEERLWKERFPVYAEWRKKWYERYMQRGYFQSKTGFVLRSVMSRNDVTNYPVQGSAFHVLLETCNRLNRVFIEEDLPVYMPLQIHDAVLMDHDPNYASKLDALVKETIQGIQKDWTWINVPLVLEAERGHVNGNWYKLEEIHL